MENSINTNTGSGIALGDLAFSQKQLQQAQKRVSTGYLVADAFDNGAVFGMAQLVRGDIAGNVAASAELGNFSGAVQTANAGATQISNTLSDLRTVLTHLSSSTLSVTQFQQYSQQFYSLTSSIQAAVVGSAYNGLNLLSTSQVFNVLGDGIGNNIRVKGSDFQMIGVATTASVAPAPVILNITSNFTDVHDTFAISNFTSFASGYNPPANPGQKGVVVSGSAADINYFNLDISYLNASTFFFGPLTFFQWTVGSAINTLPAPHDPLNTPSVANFQYTFQTTPTGIIITGGGLAGSITVNAADPPTGGGGGGGGSSSVTTDSIYGALFNMGSSISMLSPNALPQTATPAAVQAAAQQVRQYMDTNFLAIENSTSTVLNNIGALNNRINSQLSFNASIRDALSVGLGATVDADMAQESANILAAQLKQQLAVQSLAIANGFPNVLLRLFG
ncbi:MAG: flagellin [Candidatus Symbiobacter sp.]|nr:flagellin [Candidatus Symbiobacter sp.]